MNDQVIDANSEQGQAEITDTPAPDWYYSKDEGAEIAGTGEKPDYLLSKYASVADQAKAYPELASKFGSFTGAPEQYDHEFLGDDYEFTDEFTEVSDALRDMGVNQEGYEKLISLQRDREENIHKAYNNPEAEVEALGKDGQRRIDNVDRYLQANLDDETYDRVAPGVNSAAVVEAFEILIQATKPKALPSEGGENPTGMTEDKLLQMRRAKTEGGDFRMSVDPDYRKMVEGEWERYYGNRAHTSVVGE